jgi:hypothetical protein
MLRRNREIVIFNLSAIDLFCSGMGAVMVLMVLLMPYYRKTDPIPLPEPPVAVVPPPAPPIPEPPKPTPAPGIQVRAIDVVFVMDATMSMDEELSEVRSGMESVVQVLRRLSDEVRVGFVAYTDRNVQTTIPLRPVGRGPVGDANLLKLLLGISGVRLENGVDWPEDVCGGLEKASKSMTWSSIPERRQVIVLIGDAETHPEDRSRSIGIVKNWVSASENRSVNGVNTGKNVPKSKSEFMATRLYFKEITEAGNGQYFEDSGDLLGSILDILIVR